MQFTAEDAQAMIQLARLAPLKNMEVAESASGIIARATNYFASVFAPPAPPAPPVETKAEKPSKKKATNGND